MWDGIPGRARDDDGSVVPDDPVITADAGIPYPSVRRGERSLTFISQLIHKRLVM